MQTHYSILSNTPFSDCPYGHHAIDFLHFICPLFSDLFIFVAAICYLLTQFLYVLFLVFLFSFEHLFHKTHVHLVSYVVVSLSEMQKIKKIKIKK